MALWMDFGSSYKIFNKTLQRYGQKQNVYSQHDGCLPLQILKLWASVIWVSLQSHSVTNTKLHQNWIKKYGDMTTFKMAVVRQFEFSKFVICGI